jgi:hypothetical protein
VISYKLTVIGQEEATRLLRSAPTKLKDFLLAEMNAIGGEIQNEAARLAPFNAKRKSGTHLRDALRHRSPRTRG